ncbi:hypothetical protein ACFO4E_14720 [Nocardiopsis mangrovi]|uniref:Uncharacterized protein n=1 Tax=Nocardiopsis mangrovi TaxID=1179818 RepID=A0ABV9DW37_9ACTN
MAIHVLFARSGEGPDTVSYTCGDADDPARFRFTLGVDDFGLRGWGGGPVPNAVRWARAKVVRTVRETGAWPARGAYCA